MLQCEALTQVELDRGKCETPGCTCDPSTLFLSASCHPRAGLDVLYVKATGILEISCKRCRTQIVSVAVASGMEGRLGRG